MKKTKVLLLILFAILMIALLSTKVMAVEVSEIEITGVQTSLNENDEITFTGELAGENKDNVDIIFQMWSYTQNYGGVELPNYFYTSSPEYNQSISANSNWMINYNGIQEYRYLNSDGRYLSGFNGNQFYSVYILARPGNTLAEEVKVKINGGEAKTYSKTTVDDVDYVFADLVYTVKIPVYTMEYKHNSKEPIFITVNLANNKTVTVSAREDNEYLETEAGKIALALQLEELNYDYPNENELYFKLEEEQLDDHIFKNVMPQFITKQENGNYYRIVDKEITDKTILKATKTGNKDDKGADTYEISCVKSSDNVERISLPATFERFVGTEKDDTEYKNYLVYDEYQITFEITYGNGDESEIVDNGQPSATPTQAGGTAIPTATPSASSDNAGKVKVAPAAETTENKEAATAVDKLVKDIVKGTSVKGIDASLAEKINAAITSGKTVNVEVKKENIEKDKITEDAKKIEEKIKSGTKVAAYFDIDVLISAGEVSGNVTELGDEITLEVDIPTDLPKVADGFTRKYTVVRVHDGVAEELEAKVVNNKISFASKLFSTYALTYTDVANTSSTNSPKTGDNIALFIGLFILSAVGSYFVFRKIKK